MANSPRGAFPTDDAFSAIGRSLHLTYSRQPAALPPAVDALQQVTRRTPEVELAWTSLARLYLMNHTLELADMTTPIDMAIGCANQSVMLEPASARTRCLMEPRCWSRASSAPHGASWNRRCGSTAVHSPTVKSSAGCWHSAASGTRAWP